MSSHTYQVTVTTSEIYNITALSPGDAVDTFQYSTPVSETTEISVKNYL